MKKTVSIALALMLALLSAVPAFAAGDVTWSKDTTLTNFINRYDNATVKAGVTLTMKEFKPDPQGLEIVKSLTVEQGGKITGGGTIIFERGAVCTGLELYYKVAGKEKLLPVTLAELVKTEPSADYRPTFNFDSSTGHYVLAANYASDPFETPQPADGGSGSGAADAAGRDLAIAKQLEQLGLMKGAGRNTDGSTNFALDRAPTRVEAVVLLIRLLGKEEEANAFDPAKCPFSDAPNWAREELAYAYETGLANGVGGGKFGTGNATPQQFLTFVLRAMGYSDSGSGADFSWRSPETLAMNTGILGGEGDLQNFTRGTCVRIMEAALRNSLKTGGRLWEKLAADGVFTEAQYKSVMGQ